MNTLRIVVLFVLILVIQIWVLAPVLILSTATIWFYPVCLSLLPMNTRRVSLLWIGFALGAIIDMLMMTPGLHTAVMTFVALMRYYVLRPMLDKNMDLEESPSFSSLRGGSVVLLAVIMLIHHVLLYTLDAGLHFDTHNLLWRLLVGYVSSFVVALLAHLTFPLCLKS